MIKWAYEIPAAEDNGSFSRHFGDRSTREKEALIDRINTSKWFFELKIWSWQINIWNNPTMVTKCLRLKRLLEIAWVYVK